MSVSLFSKTARVALVICVAAAAGAVVAADEETKVVSRSEPGFPREALAAGAEKGHVHARLTIDAKGEVSRVEIVEANPQRIFDRAVTRTLAQWRFNSGADGRAFDVDVDFQR